MTGRWMRKKSCSIPGLRCFFFIDQQFFFVFSNALLCLFYSKLACLLLAFYTHNPNNLAYHLLAHLVDPLKLELNHTPVIQKATLRGCRTLKRCSNEYQNR
jgi:hypothetical protein